MAEPVRHRLEESARNGSKADRALATYILAKTSSLPFETAASLAEKVGVSEATVGRFCRSLGCKSFKDLKEQFRQDIGDRPWLIADRLKEFQERSLTDQDALGQALQLEMAGLVAVYELARGPEWQRVVTRLTRARRVFVAGFQTERAMADMFTYQLHYLRDGVHNLDLAGGNFVELLATDTPEDACLVMFEARRYSRLAQLLAREAGRLGIPVTLVTDAFCAWGPDLVSEMFVVPTEFNLFWDSTAQMATLINLMMNAVSIAIGPEVEARMTRVSQLYSHFIGHVGDAGGPDR